MRDARAIEVELIRFLREDLKVREHALDPQAALFSSGLLDSFALVALLAWAERRFGVSLGQASSVAALDTVRALARRIAGGRLAIVTAADATYFSLLQGMVGSVREAGAAGTYELCVVDLGLTPEQRAWAEDAADHVVEGRWDLEFPGRDETPRHIQGLTCRPFLPGYFPGFDVYLWVDADAWVQDWAAVELFVSSCRDGSIAVAPEVDRAYACHYDEGVAERWWHARYEAAFGRHTANRLWRHPGICAGVFALRGDSPGWHMWAESLREAVQRTTDSADQTALAVAIYTEALPATFLPSEAHWVSTYALPRLDRATGLLTHPMPPYAVLGIVHLVGRAPKSKPVALPASDGGSVTRWLTWRGVPNE